MEIPVQYRERDILIKFHRMRDNPEDFEKGVFDTAQNALSQGNFWEIHPVVINAAVIWFEGFKTDGRRAKLLHLFSELIEEGDRAMISNQIMMGGVCKLIEVIGVKKFTEYSFKHLGPTLAEENPNSNRDRQSVLRLAAAADQGLSIAGLSDADRILFFKSLRKSFKKTNSK